MSDSAGDPGTASIYASPDGSNLPMGGDTRLRRRRIGPETPPEAPGDRHRAWWAGGIIGVIVGVLVAFLALPPIFDRYFGFADIALGEAHTEDSVTLTALGYAPGESADAAGTSQPTIVVTLRAVTGLAWDPGAARITLEFEDGRRVTGARLTAEGSVAPVSRLAPGEDAILALTFTLAAESESEPRLIEFKELKSRFHLQPGDPRDE